MALLCRRQTYSFFFSLKLLTMDSEEKNWENWSAAWIEKLVDYWYNWQMKRCGYLYNVMLKKHLISRKVHIPVLILTGSYPPPPPAHPPPKMKLICNLCELAITSICGQQNRENWSAAWIEKLVDYWYNGQMKRCGYLYNVMLKKHLISRKVHIPVLILTGSVMITKFVRGVDILKLTR